MTSRPNRFLFAMQTLFLILWFLLLLALHILLVLWLAVNGGDMLWFPVALIALWWGLSLLVNRLSDRRQARRKKEYRARNVVQMATEHPRFGRITFDYDVPEQSLEAVDSTLPVFCGENPDALCVELYGNASPQDAVSHALDALCAAYDRQEEILSALCGEVRETYTAEGLDEAYTDPEWIRGNLGVSGFAISLGHPECGTSVTVLGGMRTDLGEHIAEHGVSAVLTRRPGSDEWELSEE